MNDLQKYIEQYQNAIGCTIDDLVETLQSILSKDIPGVLINTRVKSSKGIDRKMKKKGTSNIFALKDVYGIRIITDTVDSAYMTYRKIIYVFPGFLKHDYIAHPKTRRGIPKLQGKKVRFLQYVAYKNGVPFEIQITTKEFHKENEILHNGYIQRKYFSP